jgi:Capsule assembly protein Wzi
MKNMESKTYKALLFFLMVIWMVDSFGQAVYENVNNSIYPYLYRQAQKGNIDLKDMVRPLNRNQISAYLVAIEKRADSTPTSLNAIEKKELGFYLQEYGRGGVEGTVADANEQWLRKDVRGRLRFFSLIDEGSSKNSTNKKAQPFQFNVEPIVQSSIHAFGVDSAYMRRAIGVQLWASLGKRWGFQAYYRDIYESGSGMDPLRKNTPMEGIINVINPRRGAINYADLRGSVSYQWKNGLLSVGKEQYVLGYGLNGNIIQSTKAPSYPYLRFQQRIGKWLQFEYTHGILSSGLVDTPNSYRTMNLGVYGGQRFKLIPKYYVNHALQMRLMKGLDLQIGESVVYSDKIQFGYWMPILFFKAWDQYVSGNNINAGSNTQLYAQVSSRNQLRYTHLYGSLFIDEISPTAILSPSKSRNQLGFQVGTSVTDLPFLPYVSFNAEYTRLNPFVYAHLHPSQDYTSSGYVMGDWIGSNADKAIIEIRYTPTPRLRLTLRGERIRKGDEGNAELQYFARPQPLLLWGLQRKEYNTHFLFQYEWKQNVYIHGQFQRQEMKLYRGSFATVNQNHLSLGFAIGW